MTAFTYQLVVDLGPALTGQTLEMRLFTSGDVAVAFADGVYSKQDGEAGMTILERAGGRYTVNCSQWPYEAMPYTVLAYDALTGFPIPGALTEFNRLDFTESAAGAGEIAFTYTLTNSVTGLPIAGANVWATTDEAGTNIVASGVTNIFGQVVFFLDAGTYHFFRALAGFAFINPDTEIVS